MAIKYAREGFPLSEVIAYYWESGVRRFKQYPNFQNLFAPGGKILKKGDIFKNPDLAQTLSIIAEKGRDVFYKGEIAKAMVAYSQRVGGFFSLEDFSGYHSEWASPESANYRGYDVWELPPNGQGIAAQRLRYFSPERASRQIPAGDKILEDGDTVYLTVVDRNFNAVSFIQSNYSGFGSAMVPDHLGFGLQDRGALFSLEAGHPNVIAPGKRPFHTIIPGFVTKDGEPVFSFGVMGGAMQPQGHVQVLCNIIDFGMNIQEAGDAARFRHSGSSQPHGGTMRNGSIVNLEKGILPEVIRELVRKGHLITPAIGPYGGYQGIWIDTKRGILIGASESRKDGCAIGY